MEQELSLKGGTTLPFMRRMSGWQERTRGHGWEGLAKKGLGLISEALGSHQSQRQGTMWPPFCLFQPLWLVCGERHRDGPGQLQEPQPQKPVACPFLGPLTWLSEGQSGGDPRPSCHLCLGHLAP